MERKITYVTGNWAKIAMRFMMRMKNINYLKLQNIQQNGLVKN